MAKGLWGLLRFMVFKLCSVEYYGSSKWSWGLPWLQGRKQAGLCDSDSASTKSVWPQLSYSEAPFKISFDQRALCFTKRLKVAHYFSNDQTEVQSGGERAWGRGRTATCWHCLGWYRARPCNCQVLSLLLTKVALKWDLGNHCAIRVLWPHTSHGIFLEVWTRGSGLTCRKIWVATLLTGIAWKFSLQTRRKKCPI